jgi:hypothetical protein
MPEKKKTWYVNDGKDTHEIYADAWKAGDGELKFYRGKELVAAFAGIKWFTRGDASPK